MGYHEPHRLNVAPAVILVPWFDVGRNTPVASISTRERLRRATLVAAGVTLLFAAVVLGGFIDGAVRTTIDNAGGAVAALLVGGLALLTARAHQEARLRASWILLGAGLLCWGLTDSAWTWIEMTTGQAPVTPSWTDAGYLAMIPLFFIGIVLRPPLQPRSIGRNLLTIDAWLAISALVAVGWVLVLSPMYERLGTSPLVQAIALAYPVGDLAILCCLALAVLRESEHHPATIPLLVGLALMAVADAAYALLVVQGSYVTGHPIDAIWFGSIAAIGVAAEVERGDPAPRFGRTWVATPEAPWRLMTPAVLLVLATVVVWGVALGRGGTPGGVAEIAIGIAWMLLLLRLYLEYRGVTESHRRERQLRVGHATSMRREQHRLRQLEAVQGATSELTRELDLTALLALITRRASDLVHAPMGAAFLWDEEAGLLVPRAWHGIGSWFGAVRIRRNEGVAGRAIELGRGAIVNDHQAAREAFLPLIAQGQITSALATPIFSLGRLVGVIVVADDRIGRTFDEADLSAIDLFADQAAVAIEHARLVDEAASVEALRELALLKSELLSTVSHELRTPLTLIHGYAELLQARAEFLTPDDVTMMADEILLGSRTMIRLVDDLLDFSRRDTARIQLERSRLDLSNLLRRHIHAWRGQPGGDRLRLDAPEPHEVEADPARLDQVIRNLISNALHHATDGPVSVRVVGEGAWVRLDVADRGPGIPEEELPRIWDSFFRGERARNSPNRGSGLGLAVVRQLVELHGGRVEVESQLGVGTTFHVWLPSAPHSSTEGVIKPEGGARESVDGSPAYGKLKMRSEGE